MGCCRSATGWPSLTHTPIPSTCLPKSSTTISLFAPRLTTTVIARSSHHLTFVTHSPTTFRILQYTSSLRCKHAQSHASRCAPTFPPGCIIIRYVCRVCSDHTYTTSRSAWHQGTRSRRHMFLPSIKLMIRLFTSHTSQRVLRPSIPFPQALVIAVLASVSSTRPPVGVALSQSLRLKRHNVAAGRARVAQT